MASFICSLLLLVTLHAQQGVSQDSGGELSHVTGHVLKPGTKAMVPVANTWVTLHRVGTDRAGPLDSMRTSATGEYAFTYRRFGAAEAMYFASSSYGGVAYISKPFQSETTSGDDAEIDVFDTTSRVVPMTVRGRHLIISAPIPGGERRVTEVFDLSNDSTVARLASNDTPQGAVWSSLLPTGASHLQVSNGDIPAQAVKFVNGRAFVYAPFAPGLKQFVYTYTLSQDAFPLSLPAERPTSVFEVLLEEPNAVVKGVHMRQEGPVDIEGRHFQRYLAPDVPASGMMTVSVAKADMPINVWYVAGLIVVIGGLMTVTLARAVRRR
ncbi:MAG TPA: hypothetical protein VNU46_02230 [Gemmatimonadaceae bacterium]|nr:hypothetical protein [Gemmatimonadaceae bacterium]